ncbi:MULTISPECIES: DUF262 domain-containing protein [Bacillus]|nr:MULTISPECIES: DUF262 domain-containing protein [Bacillus]KQU11534.1 hypothetical protein ASG46_10020 [Bacillus sp. Leaf49]MCY7621858.1 DUF262 domain-containing protein [Bacillus altitudinis]MDI6560025.1 DUF262 domain-containing protein [Bacillus altitudinis]MED0850393.1 DUF262 domain-containing protein [Bacillus altitudinis]WEZ72865.1 DUF262 domain-containing protein [Bacillus altitudinis]
MVKDKEILLTPEYQRNFIWDTNKCSLLVESILLNIPIPVIYASEEKDSVWNIVDGLQRLTALNRFINNQFKLKGLKVLSELNNLKYDELPSKASRVLKNGNLRTILIFNDSHPEIKYDIFMRLNSGAVKLNEQELRNCLYRGRLNQLLKKLTHTPKFMQILGLKKPHKRMTDQEMILRYLAFSEGYNELNNNMEGYKGATKTYLNSYFEKNQDISEVKLHQLENKFNSVIDSVYEVFGDKAFRKLNEDGYETKINKAIMDVIMISFQNYTFERIQAKKAEILLNYKEILTDQDFNKSVTQGTSDTKALEYRLSSWISKMESTMSTVG